MEMMNIQHGPSIIQVTYEYDKEMRAFHFKDDIKIGYWTVLKNIRIGGPETSIYKYDFNNYLEFVIIDKRGESRIKQYYYNCFSDEIIVNQSYDDDISQRGIRLFLENHPLFDCIDWNDYDASAVISKIKETVNSDNMNNVDKINKIRSLLK